MTTLFIDGDACPVREECYRVATRLALPVVLVANGSRPIRPTGLPNVRTVVVNDTPDAADDWIADAIRQGDLCVTADIPLASRCLAAGARAVSGTGHVWTADNIGQALAGRELSRHLREMGMESRHAPMGKADRSRFLSALDTLARAAMRDAPAPTPPRVQ